MAVTAAGSIVAGNLACSWPLLFPAAAKTRVFGGILLMISRIEGTSCSRPQDMTMMSTSWWMAASMAYKATVARHQLHLYSLTQLLVLGIIRFSSTGRWAAHLPRCVTCGVQL